jgi:hypothetical protein
MYYSNSGLSVTNKVRLKVNFSYEIHFVCVCVCTCTHACACVCVCVCVERERFGCMNSGLGKCGNRMKFAYVFHISYCCRGKDMLKIQIYWKGRHFVRDQQGC